MDKTALLAKMELNIKKCTKCGLCKTAKNAVSGEGNVDSDIVFIGEAPGATEDATGRPFVGRAGKLLEALLAEIDLKRSDVWIGNIIKHRPPENRDPLPDEIAACSPYLSMQLRIIDPKLIITLGRFAMNYFYEEGKITRDHGNLIKAKSHIVYPIYHPAAALRNGNMLTTLKADFLKIPSILDEVRGGKIKQDGQLGLF